MTKETSSSGGASFPVIHGTTDSQVTFYSGGMSRWTLFHVARYTGSGPKNRIFAPDINDGKVNWLSGFFNGKSGVAYHQGWLSDNRDYYGCLLYTSPSPRDRQKSRMPSSA